MWTNALPLYSVFAPFHCRFLFLFHLLFAIWLCLCVRAMYRSVLFIIQWAFILCAALGCVRMYQRMKNEAIWMKNTQKCSSNSGGQKWANVQQSHDGSLHVGYNASCLCFMRNDIKKNLAVGAARNSHYSSTILIFFYTDISSECSWMCFFVCVCGNTLWA